MVSARGIQRGVRLWGCLGALWGSFWTRPGRRAGPRRCALSTSSGLRPASVNGQTPEGTVGERTSRWLTGNQPFQAGCSGAEGRPRASRPLGPSGGVSTGRDRVHPVPADRSSRDRFGIGRARPLNQGQWRVLSAFHPTRLETRTKESNMRASHWAVRNPEAQ